MTSVPLRAGPATRHTDEPPTQETGMSGNAYPLYWRVKVIHPEWFGRRCRIVIHGGKGNRMIEFDDGERVVCPGTYLRRVDAKARPAKGVIVAVERQLLEHGPASAVDLAESLYYSRRQIYLAIARLRDLGVLEHRPATYRLVEKPAKSGRTNGSAFAKSSCIGDNSGDEKPRHRCNGPGRDIEGNPDASKA